jgi:hypothetical protein
LARANNKISEENLKKSYKSGPRNNGVPQGAALEIQDKPLEPEILVMLEDKKENSDEFSDENPTLKNLTLENKNEEKKEEEERPMSKSAEMRANSVSTRSPTSRGLSTPKSKKS